ncbi:MAG: hypothetical protein CM15mP45_01760 [Deltaproteobacteria bacterium]|nr:MAG: hypothetical protein CM15mP45_01760 [Deltaproteobacteria bacterium]
MIVILIVPVFVAGTFSFTDYNLGSPDFRWIGWKNYEALTKYSSYKKMFSASLTYVVIVVPFSVLLGLGAALLISSLRFGGEIYKTVFFLRNGNSFGNGHCLGVQLDPVVGLVNKFL